MADIYTTDVRVTANIEGVTMHATYVETKRQIGPTAGVATIEGFVEDPGSLELNQMVEVYMGTDDEFGESVRNKLFQGKVKKATQNEKGKITVEAYDELIEMHNKFVKYTNEDALEAWKVLNDVLEDAGYSPVTGDGGGPKQPQIISQNDIPGTETVGKHKYGSGRRGESLTNVLADLATKLGCRLWVDKENTLKILPYPEYNNYDLKYITSVDGGDETVNENKVLVQGGSAVSNSGQAAASLYNQIRIQADAISGDSDEEEREFSYSDNNIITQEEANRTAASNQFDREIARDAGSVEIVGNPTPELFDVVTVPPLQSHDSFDAAPTPQWVESSYIEDNQFSVTGITHVADTQEGYLTTMELGPEPTEQFDVIGGIADAIANELSDKIDENKEDPASPLNFLPGFE